MSSPYLRSPLHDFSLEKEARPVDQSCGVWVNEISLRGYISLRGEGANATFVEAVSKTLGVPLPTKPCTLSAVNSTKVLWFSPDEWMISCPRNALPKLLAELREALKGVRSQVVDNSGGYTEILLTGKNATDALGHVTVYDLSELDTNKVVGTTFGKLSVYLHRETSGYSILLRRSFADYIWRLLVRAAEPYGFAVATRNGNAAR